MFVRGSKGLWRKQDGWVSTCYAARSRAPVLVFSMTGAGSQEFVTFLVPRAAQASQVQVRQIEARGGRAFEVHDGSVRDLVVLGRGQRVEAGPIKADFEWIWARWTAPSGLPSEFVLLGGSFLIAEGKELFRAAQPASFVVIRCLGGKMTIETDADRDRLVPPREAEALCGRV
jgi:hypothetical protein